MPTILLHSSKTMRIHHSAQDHYQAPQLLKQAEEMADFIQSLSIDDIQSAMKLSAPMAAKTQQLLSGWSANPDSQTPAIDAFLGDIYSGLQVQTFSDADRDYANDHLYILSGLYGALRALDSIAPYRLEMGYRFTQAPYDNLYAFWGKAIAECIPTNEPIINVSADEYTKTVLPYMPDTRIVAPRFLTADPDGGEPKFVVVHTKIARGAFARWLIQQRITNLDRLKEFSDLGYQYDNDMSTPDQPVFVCKQFEGLGLSIRLS
jgi:cytoplasmic iron level regulating protein YaaA (DUF328/UPF0246 family)